MYLYSTNDPNMRVGIKEAIFKGMPEDNGLYMPHEVPKLEEEFIRELSSQTFEEISFVVAKKLLQDAIPDSELEIIIRKAINFPAPVVKLNDKNFVLELFHGPSLAFKDFGARFMAQVMAYFNRGEERKLTILVATSGDTGGAVAAGFLQTPDIEVVILYPSGKVSPLQEKQITTLGHNVTALEVDGTFDDCQNLVKQAFLDPAIVGRIRLTSANSINIARLIPQSFYYFEAYKQIEKEAGALPIVFAVPSGNFGNLTAGLLAKRMGLPVHCFIAATNANNVVPEYLRTGAYLPRLSKRTLSNAMDVGAPSNFSRMLDLYGSTWNSIRKDVAGYSFSDDATKNAMREIDSRYGGYTMDPHGAVGYLALREYQKAHSCLGIILETAHPAKFVEDVEEILGRSITVPDSLQMLMFNGIEKKSVKITSSYEDFKEWLLHRN